MAVKILVKPGRYFPIIVNCEKCKATLMIQRNRDIKAGKVICPNCKSQIVLFIPGER